MSKCGVVLVNCFPDEREMYADYLRAVGYNPVESCDTDVAFDSVVTMRPAVMITDLVLPGGGDGIELIRRVRADPRTVSTTVVVVTGQVYPSDRVRAERAGSDVFLAKPCLPEDLAAEVDRACTARNLEAGVR